MSLGCLNDHATIGSRCNPVIPVSTGILEGMDLIVPRRSSILEGQGPVGLANSQTIARCLAGPVPGSLGDQREG